ncbi:MAG: prephenate dehydrogenase/arogenate dehydrogenase family protein [Fibrobacteres bacterium]|nr:prephenate dehydrogenase/arogenate dehydrogenase family protein [Fibrobacterota bacterium]
MEGRPQRLAVVGLGLLGASLAEAARKRWPGLQVTGVSSPATLEKAKTAGLIESGFPYEGIDAAAADADLLVLCTPIDQIAASLEAWARRPAPFRPGSIVTDVGSTKAGLCALGRAAFPADGSRGAVFVGSHPMAGSEKTGIEARDPLLFQNASWVICPESDGLPPEQAGRVGEAADRLRLFAQGLGARVTRMPAGLHDRVAAHVSHLPQLLSTALAAYVGGRRDVVENCVQIAGGGFRDMTRLAASQFHVWEPILRTNREAVAEAFRGFRLHLDGLETALDGDLGAGYFREANRLRAQLSTAKKGFALPLSEILVDLEDKPGELVRAFAPLAEAGLNVLDTEILKVREGEGGVLMMGFPGAVAAEKAIAALRSAGFKARTR